MHSAITASCLLWFVSSLNILAYSICPQMFWFLPQAKQIQECLHGLLKGRQLVTAPQFLTCMPLWVIKKSARAKCWHGLIKPYKGHVPTYTHEHTHLFILCYFFQNYTCGNIIFNLTACTVIEKVFHVTFYNVLHIPYCMSSGPRLHACTHNEVTEDIYTLQIHFSSLMLLFLLSNKQFCILFKT